MILRLFHLVRVLKCWQTGLAELFQQTERFNSLLQAQPNNVISVVANKKCIKMHGIRLFFQTIFQRHILNFPHKLSMLTESLYLFTCFYRVQTNPPRKSKVFISA